MASRPGDEGEPFSLADWLVRLIHVNGWTRLLAVEPVEGTRLVRVRRADLGDDTDFSENDIVETYSAEDVARGTVTRDSVKGDCRRFLLRNALL